MREPALVPPHPSSARWVTPTLLILQGLFAGGFVLSGLLWGSTLVFHWPESYPQQVAIPIVVLYAVAIAFVVVSAREVFRWVQADDRPLYKKWLLLSAMAVFTVNCFVYLFNTDVVIRALLILSEPLLIIPLLLLALFSFRSLRKRMEADQSAGQARGTGARATPSPPVNE